MYSCSPTDPQDEVVSLRAQIDQVKALAKDVAEAVAGFERLLMAHGAQSKTASAAAIHFAELLWQSLLVIDCPGCEG